jgi:hypothetical protein
METRTAAWLLTLLLASPAAGAGVPLLERAVLTAPDAMPLDHLGLGVALSRDGGIALAGATQAGCAAGLDCGAVYAYFGGGATWGLSGKLTASDAAANDNFGRAIALSADGSIALIGAPGKNCRAGTGCGAAYIFTGSGASWTQDVRLTPLDVASGDLFGTSVTLSADSTTAIVGKPGDTCGLGFGCGAAYIFMGSVADWTQIKKLTAGDP